MEEFKKPIGFSKVPAKEPETDEKNEKKFNQDQLKLTIKKPSAPNLPQAECPYLEPKWSNTPSNQSVEYKFEILKSGAILEEIKNLQSKAFWVIGRLDQNDIPMAHPTVSRFHAALQYRPPAEDMDGEESKSDAAKLKSTIESGWYIYDLGSTHGTFLNKAKIPQKAYIRVRVGHMLKFGASSRSFILQGPEVDEEPESELTVTEIKERRKQEAELKQKQEQMQEEQREKEGVSWGMAEDADEETDLTVNPYATTNNEELFLDDPKKTLRGYFEREGLTLDYKCDEMSPGTFVCRIDLPIYDANGKTITAEVCHKGKKKDCVAQAALEACRILDRQGVLRQSHHEPLKRKIQAANSDDEDDFLDRTGDIERKKLRKATAGQSVTLTYDDLVKQEEELQTKLIEVEREIETYQESSKKVKENKAMEDDDLDNYMENLAKKSVSIDKTEIRKLRVEESRLRAEILKVKKLIKIAKPFDLPPISGSQSARSTTEKKATLPLFGKRNKSRFTIKNTSSETTKVTTAELKSDEEEVEEDEESAEKSNLEVKAAPNLPVQQIEPLKKERTENNEKTEILETETKIYGPAVIPKGILESSEQEMETSNEPSSDLNIETSNENRDNDKANEENIEKIEKITEWTSKSPPVPKAEMDVDEKQMSDVKDDPNNETEAEESIQDNKKRKTRTRNRHRRENVDIDDYEEFIDVEKHSNWVPPKNQSGDGRTTLNDKFGY